MTDHESSLARIEERLDHIAGQLDELRPLLLERSGDLRRMERFERDLNGLGEKHRTSTSRQDAFEGRLNENDRRLARWAGVLTTLLAVLQAGWALFGDSVRAALLGGAR